MKRFFTLLFVLLAWCFSPCPLLAKDGNIKLGKFLIFTGEVEKKMPNGQGLLHLLNPQNKKEDFCVISGEVKDTTATELTFSSNGSYFPDFRINGNIYIKIGGERKKCKSFDIVAKDATLGMVRSNISLEDSTETDLLIVEDITLSFNQTEEGWAVEIADNTPEPVSGQYFHKDNIIKKNNSTASPIGFRNCFIGKHSQASILMHTCGYHSSEAYSFFQIGRASIEAVSPTISISNDGTALCNNTFHNSDKGYTYSFNSSGWDGNVLLNDGTLISNTSNKIGVEVKWADGSTYSGTLKKNLFPFVNINTTLSPSDFLNGLYTKDGKSESWIKGESMSAFYKRISTLYDEDLVTSIKNGEITEAQAAHKQKIREEAKKAAEAEERAQFILQELFGDKETVSFSCKSATGTSPLEDDVLGAMGIDSGEDIIYDITLQLNKKNMKGSFSFFCKPSQEANYNNRIHYSRTGERIRHYEYVQDLCDRLNRRLSINESDYVIEGNTIKIDGNKFILSDDVQSVKYSALEVITLKRSSGTASNKVGNKVSFPKSLVGRRYIGVVHMGEIDDYIKTVVTFTFKNERTLTAHYSFKSQNDKGVKLLLEMLGPGITEDKKDFEYTYSNGVVKIKGSNETCTLKDNNKVLYWYASDEMNGNLYLK